LLSGIHEILQTTWSNEGEYFGKIIYL